MFFQGFLILPDLALPLLNSVHVHHLELVMLKNSAQKKKNPLTKAQSRLLKESLKKLLGNGLLRDSEPKDPQVKQMILKDALNAIILE